MVDVRYARKILGFKSKWSFLRFLASKGWVVIEPSGRVFSLRLDKVKYRSNKRSRQYGHKVTLYLTEEALTELKRSL